MQQSNGHSVEASGDCARLPAQALLLLNSLTDCSIITLDPSGNITSWNAGAAEIEGFAESDVLGRHVRFLYPALEGSEEGPAEALKTAAESGRWEEEVWRPRKDGSSFCVSVQLTALRDDSGTLIGFGMVTRDVTEQRLHDDELRQSQERFRALIENSTDAIALLAEDGCVAYASQSTARVLGYSISEFVGRSAFDFVHPEDLPPVLELFQQTEENPHQLVEHHFRALHKDGRWLYMEATGINRLGDPAVRGIVVNYRDVTDRHTMEEGLAQVLEGARCLLWRATVQEVDGRLNWSFQIWNEQAAQKFLSLHVPPGESWARAWYISKDPEDREEMNRTAHEAITSGRSGYRQEFRVRLADGSVRWLFEDVRIEPESPGTYRLIGVCTDVTERKHAELALNESEQRFQAFMDHNPTVAWMKDEDGRYIYVNATFAARFERSVEDLRGKTDLDLWPPDVAEHLRRNDRTILEGGEPRELYETVPVPGGAHRHWWVLKFPFSDRSGVRCVGGIGLDVTERHQLEEQVRQLQKMEAIGQLAGGVAHEFNNLLAVVMGYSELMLYRMAQDEPMRDQVEMLRQAAERGAKLTHQILSFSRKQLVTPQMVDLSPLIENQAAMLRQLIGEDIEVVTKTASDVRSVRVDPHLVEQIILNMALNSRDAMPDGGVLTIEARNAEIGKAVTDRYPDVRAGDYVMVSVSDTGSGMDNWTLQRVFEPFFTTKEVGKGTGLGLASAYGNVKQSGGHIEVQSEPGVGTIFTVYLPVAKEVAADASGVETGQQWPEPGTGTVLVVEDEPMVRNLVGDVLRLSGYVVLTAANAEEALYVAERHEGRIHLLLTDLVMPGMSGAALANHLRSIRPDTRVLYMSGHTEPDLLRHNALPGDVPFLQKPFSPQALASRVGELLK